VEGQICSLGSRRDLLNCFFRQGNRWEAASLLLSEMRWAALPVEVESYAGDAEKMPCVKVVLADVSDLHRA
jgi:hypothetical protein